MGQQSCNPTLPNQNTADISITGKAPNAQQVTIIVNGSSKTDSVNNTNDNTFAAAPITLQKGKNLVTIRIKNGTQVIETSRDIAFYNGSVTFYDVNINEMNEATNKQSASMEYSPNFVIDTANNLKITGKVIVPNSQYEEITDPLATPPTMTMLPHPNPILNPNTLSTIKASIKKVTDSVYVNLPITSVSVVGSPTAADKFFVYQYDIDLGAASGYALDSLYNVKLTARNEENAHLNVTPTEQGTDVLYFSLRDGNEPYISQINYLPGYKPTDYQGITGVALDGKSIYGLPIGIEVLVGNSGGTDPIDVTNIKDLYNGDVDPDAGTDYVVKDTSIVTRTVNGSLQTFERVVLEFAKMPFEGTQSITIDVGGNSESAKFTLLYGPMPISIKYLMV